MALGRRTRKKSAAHRGPAEQGVAGKGVAGLGVADDGMAEGSEFAARAIRLTRAGMWWEAASRAFWPAFVWAASGLAALALGAAQVLPEGTLSWLGGGWLAGLVLLALFGLWRLQRPSHADARARVDARLPGRPLSALLDRVAVGAGDEGSAALWRAHLARMADLARLARPVPPATALARRDPFALRLMALTALVMAMVFGSAGQLGQGLGALAATFRAPPGRIAAPSDGPGWEGWAKPPDYTRRPAIYLNDLAEDAPLTLPQGSVLSFRLYGGGAALSQDLGTLSGEADAPEVMAERSGTVSVGGRDFEINVIPDAPPVILAGAAPQRRADGRLVQSFRASDDNGVAEGTAQITLDLAAVDRRYGLAIAPEPREPLVLPLPLPGRGSRAEIEGSLTADLARHPFANLPVTLRLTATDAIGQRAEAAPMQTILPGRRFFDPLAAALIELRRDLLWSADNAARTAEMLRAVSWQPQGFMDKPLWDELRGITASLEAGPLAPERRDEIAETLWEAAVMLEDGGLADALERMERAQERLSEAIRQGATPDEIQRLMDELKAATDAYTDMLAEQGETDPSERFAKGQEGQRITGDQIQAMMDEIQRLMNEGRMAEAQELLEQFNRMMQNLKVTQGEGGEGRQGGGQPQDRLSDTLREQQKLADEAMRQMQQGSGMPRAGEQGESGQEGQQGGTGQGSGDLAQRQRALRQDLGQQRGLLPGPGTESGERARGQLDRAGRAMEEAEQALRQGDEGAALDRQAEAIEAMREGLRALGEMQGNAGGEQPGEGQAREPGDAPQGPPGDARTQSQAMPYLPRPPTDPLGRALSGNGSSITTGEPLAQGGVDPAARARDLLDEIRRRSVEAGRSLDERGYLGRLLDRF